MKNEESTIEFRMFIAQPFLNLHLFSRANEIREKTEKVQDEINQLDMDLEEHHGNDEIFAS